jgi:hypothetical protein
MERSLALFTLQISDQGDTASLLCYADSFDSLAETGWKVAQMAEKRHAPENESGKRRFKQAMGGFHISGHRVSCMDEQLSAHRL